MYRPLILNTLISAVAYFVISVVGIVVVSWLVGAYGLEVYGVIMLARLLLPTGLMGIMDLGAPENASYVVATARATGDWETAGAMLAALVVILGAVTLLPCGVVVLFASTIAQWFHLVGDDAVVFAQALKLSAVFLPLLLIGSIAEGVIRGFERYGAARGIEVVMALAYGMGCYICVRDMYSYDTIVYLAIVLAIVRAVVALLFGWRCLATTPVAFAQWRTLGMSKVKMRIRVSAPNKMLGTLQTQTPAFLVGVFLGPASVAIYDVLTRLPRVAKSVLGLLNSAVMPFTSRLEAAEQNVSRVAENGMLFIACWSVPPLFAAASFSYPLLHLWIGKELTGFWIWQSLAFTVPLLTVLLSFGFSTLFSRIQVNKSANQFIALRIVVQYAVALALMAALTERAFILGSVIAVAATAFWEFRIIFREHRIGVPIIKNLLLLTAIGIVLMGIAIPMAIPIDSLGMLAVGMAIYTAVYWALAWILVIPQRTKKALINHCFSV